MDELSRYLPRKIEATFDLPKVHEMCLATSKNHVLQFIEMELALLSGLVSVGGNLTDMQIQFLAVELLNDYPNETIADFKICFTNGAKGHYGEIFRLDPIVISGWMKKHLDEKYAILETQLREERDQYWKPIVPENSDRDWHAEWLEAVNKSDGFKQVPTLTEEEIKKEGQAEPVKKVYEYNESEAQIKLRENREKLWVYQERTVRERHPDWTEEQILQHCADLKAATIYEDSRPKFIFPAIEKIWAPKKKKKSA